MRHEVLIDTIVVPMAFEEQGYTSQAIGDRIRNEIEHIEREAKTSAIEEKFAATGEVELPDITVPMTGLTYRSIVGFLQDTLGWQPQRVTGEITSVSAGLIPGRGQDPSKESFLVSVHVANLMRTSVVPFNTSLVQNADPEKIASAMAKDTIHLIDPYILAAYCDSRKKTDEALKLIAECDGPLKKWGFNLRGNIFMSRQPADLKSAIAEYMKAIAIDRKFAPAYNGLGNALRDSEPPDFDGAIVEYETAIAIDQKYAVAHSNMGNALSDEQPPDFDGAIAEYHKAIAIDHKYANAHNGLGNALLNKKPPDLHGAIVEYQKAITIDPEDAIAFDHYSLALHQQGKWVEALKMRSEYLELDPNDPTAYTKLDDTIRSIPDPDLGAATVEFKQATKADADSWAVNFILAQMEKRLGSQTPNAETR